MEVVVPHETTYPLNLTPDQQLGTPFSVKVQWLADGGEVGVAAGHLDDTHSVVWLDRRGINKLIRDLRRARNQACGADE